MTLTLQQIENRKKGIGASEAATVLGLNQNISPYQLWLIKTGRSEPEDLSNIPCVYWGTVHEDNILRHYEKVMNCKVNKPTETMFHIEHSFMLCHPDGIVEGLSKLLECKFAMFAKDQWGENGTDIVPMNYIVQVQYQMSVTGTQECDLAVLIGGYDFRVYHFKRDESLIKRITDEVVKFWKLVESDTPPTLRDRVDAVLAYPLSNGNLKDAEPEVLTTLEKFKEIRSKVKELDKMKEQLSSKLALFIQDADGIKINDEVIATFKTTKTGSRQLRVIGE